MNAYLIAAKANAWEIDQHVGRAVDAEQPEYIFEAMGHGEGICAEDRQQLLSHHHKSFKEVISGKLPWFQN